ncbi:MAG: amidohydrolase family protein [Planctomycetota bacterium]
MPAFTAIVDTHTHYWHPPVYDRAIVERFLRLNRAAGIATSIELGNVGAYGPYPTPEQLREANDQTLALVRDFPAELAGLVYVNPSHGQAALDEINRCVRDGNLIGIKLWVSNRAGDERVFPVAERALDLDVGILQHTWNKTVDQGADESTTRDVVELARRYPALRIQVAHLTGINFWGVLDLVPFPNVVVDTSGGQPQSGLVEFAVRHLGAERVVYGSDWPIRDLGCQVARVTGSKLTPAEQRQVLSTNARRFWKLPPEPAEAQHTAPVTAGQVVAPAAGSVAAGEGLSDVNAWFGPYPSNRHFPRRLAELAAELARAGIAAAHVTPTEAIFGHEPADDCLRLAAAIAALDRPPVTLTPGLCLRANQPADRRRLPELARKTGARVLHLLPTYHGYRVEDEACLAMVRFARELGLLTAVHLRLEDRRCTDPRLVTVDLGVEAVLKLAAAVAPTALLVCNAYGPEVRRLLKGASNVRCDLSMVESGNTLPDLCQELPAGEVYPRLVFGSHAPFLYPGAVAAKLGTPEIDGATRSGLAQGNLRRLVAEVEATPGTAPAGS